ncbi:MAG: endonuclease/exonuclease/phosphatase family protein [Candidatus Omnitrophota bacterium]
MVMWIYAIGAYCIWFIVRLVRNAKHSDSRKRSELIVFLYIPVVLTLAGFLSKYGWLFDLASHFRLQYLVVLSIGILLCVIDKKWYALKILAVAALVNLVMVGSLYWPRESYISSEYQASPKTATILLMNLNANNEEYGKVIRYIKEMNPDILALEEVNDKWLAALAEILKGYSYRRDISREDCFGIGLYSKIPVDVSSIQYYGSIGLPSVLAQMTLGNKLLTVLLTHPLPPGSPEGFRQRNEQLSAIATQRLAFRDSMILIGDLNTTSWAYYFQDFVKKMNLVDTRQGFGLQLSWPVMMPLLAITIDHILVSKDFTVLERRTGPDVGSDHRPVYVKLGV